MQNRSQGFLGCLGQAISNRAKLFEISIYKLQINFWTSLPGETGVKSNVWLVNLILTKSDFINLES